MATHGSTTVVYAALAGNALISITKFVAAALTGSSAMMSEGVHSLVDTGNQLLLLHGIRQSKKPPTKAHPFGFGLQLYFWAFVVAILIFGLGSGISIYEGIDKIRHPHPVSSAWVNYIVLSLGLVFEGAVWVIAFRSFQKDRGPRTILQAVRASKDPTVFTVLFEDTAALLGLLTALIGIFLAERLEMPVLDGVSSVVIGLILAITAAFLAYECQSLLTGESVAPETREGLRKLLEQTEGVAHVNELLTMHFGPDDVLVVVSLDFDDALGAADVEETVDRVENAAKTAYPIVKRIFIEAQSLKGHASSTKT